MLVEISSVLRTLPTRMCCELRAKEPSVSVASAHQAPVKLTRCFARCARMLHKLLKIFGWTTAGLVGLAIGLYSIAVAINWRDQPPSADAVRFTAIHRDRPPVADQDNAFVYLMGADARP